MKIGLGTSGTSLNIPTLNHRGTGRKEEEEEQEIENLFEKIMEENLPNLVKEIDLVQEAQRVPKKLDPKEHTKAHHNYITQD